MTMSQEIRFDLEARCEVWVNADDIRQHEDFPAAMKHPNPERRDFELKAIAVRIAQARLNKCDTGDIQFTAYPAISDVNIDRIDWQELAKPDAHE